MSESYKQSQWHFHHVDWEHIAGGAGRQSPAGSFLQALRSKLELMFSEQLKKKKKVQRSRENQHTKVVQTISQRGRGKIIMTKAGGCLFLPNKRRQEGDAAVAACCSAGWAWRGGEDTEAIWKEIRKGPDPFSAKLRHDHSSDIFRSENTRKCCPASLEMGINHESTTLGLIQNSPLRSPGLWGPSDPAWAVHTCPWLCPLPMEVSQDSLDAARLHALHTGVELSTSPSGPFLASFFSASGFNLSLCYTLLSHYRDIVMFLSKESIQQEWEHKKAPFEPVPRSTPCCLTQPAALCSQRHHMAAFPLLEMHISGWLAGPWKQDLPLDLWKTWDVWVESMDGEHWVCLWSSSHAWCITRLQKPGNAHELCGSVSTERVVKITGCRVESLHF